MCRPAGGGRNYKKIAAAITQKPPLGRRDTSTPPPPSVPPAGTVVRRSQVCLSTFYKECSESGEPEAEWPREERNGRWAGPRAAGSRSKDVDENSNEVASPGRAGLAGKLQQLLTPTRHRASVRRAASVDDRRRGGAGARRQSRKVAETLLKAKERLVNATSEVSAPISTHALTLPVISLDTCS